MTNIIGSRFPRDPYGIREVGATFLYFVQRSDYGLIEANRRLDELASEVSARIRWLEFPMGAISLGAAIAQQNAYNAGQLRGPYQSGGLFGDLFWLDF